MLFSLNTIMADRRAFNAECQRRRRSNLAIRERENEGNRHCQRRRRADPAIRDEENERNREHNRESHRQRRADPAIREIENMQRTVIRSNAVVQMACKYVNGEFIFNQPCGEWNVPCKHGCGYYHMTSIHFQISCNALYSIRMTSR